MSFDIWKNMEKDAIDVLMQLTSSHGGTSSTSSLPSTEAD